jgi:predicted SnoaL-like aldol condensation-catalyzing enzyme
MKPPINIYPMADSAILWINAKKPNIEVDPSYQREGDVWTLEKRQLLIDSLLNGFDLPKLYFHRFARPKEKGAQKSLQYAIIDGRQRLEAIWDFVNDEFPLADDFKFFEDSKVKAGELTYSDLAREYPELKMRFDARTLPVVIVETDDIDLIEEMFSRLNEAVPLNAAEKRNAFGGPMAKAIRDVAEHTFFKTCIRFSPKRFRYREIAAQFLYLQHEKKISDTKKVYLDHFVKQFKNKSPKAVQPIVKPVLTLLDKMVGIFSASDPLLKSQSMAVIYFLIFKNCNKEKWFTKLSRKALLEFDQMRAKNRATAQEDITKATYDLLEFDRLSVQGTNDALSMTFRYETMRKFLEKLASR